MCTRPGLKLQCHPLWGRAGSSTAWAAGGPGGSGLEATGSAALSSRARLCAFSFLRGHQHWTQGAPAGLVLTSSPRKDPTSKQGQRRGFRADVGSGTPFHAPRGLTGAETGRAERPTDHPQCRRTRAFLATGLGGFGRLQSPGGAAPAQKLPALDPVPLPPPRPPAPCLCPPASSPSPAPSPSPVSPGAGPALLGLPCWV